jgi:hypothetical protein
LDELLFYLFAFVAFVSSYARKKSVGASRKTISIISKFESKTRKTFVETRSGTSSAILMASR